MSEHGLGTFEEQLRMQLLNATLDLGLICASNPFGSSIAIPVGISSQLPELILIPSEPKSGLAFKSSPDAPFVWYSGISARADFDTSTKFISSFFLISTIESIRKF